MKKYIRFLVIVLTVAMLFSVFPAVTASAAVKLNAIKVTLYVGQTYGLKLTGTSAKVTWVSTDKSIATVSKTGKVTAVEPGITTITAKVGKKRYSCVVTVKKTGIAVHMLDVGQGDAILIQVNNQNVLIDTGEEKEYDKLEKQLRHFKVNTIDKLILTHPDADHIGAADFVIKNFKVKKVYMPQRNSSSSEYTELVKALKTAKLTPINPKENDMLPLGSGVTAKVLAADAEKDNNGCSIVIRLDYYENSFLFAGDATAKVENTVMANHDVDVDVLKVAHHGSDSSSPILYLSKVSAEYALISCGDGNSYGHPSSTVLKRLEKYAGNILRTDEKGTITIKSDGKSLTAVTETIILRGETEQTQSNTFEVIGNKNSKIYHYPNCSTLPAEKNRVYFESAKAAEQAGYRLCGRED